MKTLSLFLAAALLGLAGNSAKAQIITAGGNVVVASDGSQLAPGDSTDYDFFGTDASGLGAPPRPFAGEISSLANFATTVPAGGGSYGPGSMNDTQLNTPASTGIFETGLLFTAGGGAPELTFKLTNALESSFDVFVLTQNYSFGPPDTNVTLSSDGIGSSPASQAPSITTISGGGNGGIESNDFVVFHVTGATTLDTFSINAVGGNGIGGVTFASVPVLTPEPTTWALMLGGIVSLVGFQILRRRRA